MVALARNILESQVVEDVDGKQFPLHSHTDKESGEFLQQVIQDVDASTCLEIGLAYGISALFTCEAIADKRGRRFISIDPHQEGWHDIGLINLERAGFDSFTEFHRDFPHNVLPKLLVGDVSIDFAYIDASKVFDRVLQDALYLIRILRVGGALAFDDCDFPGVKRVVRYLAKMPHLRVLAKHEEYASTTKRRLLSRFAGTLPGAKKMFVDDLLVLDEALGVNAGCVVFQKLGDDARPWDWNTDF